MNKSQCLFCKSKKCYERVVSTDNGETYDEVACEKHVKDLHKHSDEKAPKVLKHFISSTGRLLRRIPFTENNFVKMTLNKICKNQPHASQWPFSWQ